MNIIQPGILAPLPPHARYLTFSLRPGGDPVTALLELRRTISGEEMVVGLGASFIEILGKTITGLHDFPSYSYGGIDIPATPYALWCWLRGRDRGDLVHRTRHILKALTPGFRLNEVTEAFKYQSGLDLTGYVDGTENPEGDDAVQAGIVQGRGDGWDGSGFVAVQKWVHDLTRFESYPYQEQDNMIGRRKSDNVELEKAPESAHVKRTAQEDFTPPAFILRRSMPWASDTREGLVFVAFGKSTDAFEALLNRMVGAEDGIHDALFRFTRPVTGSYFWCPPVYNDKLNLKAIGLD